MSDKLAPVGEGAGRFRGALATGVAVRTDAAKPKRMPPLNEDQRKEAVRLYVDAVPRMSIREIAKHFNVAYGTMWRVLTDAGVQMRGRSGR
jgi:DNA invertase Pin-like site-specific DNA recombinase